MSKPCTFAHTRAVHRRRSVEIFTEVFTLHMVRATRSARMLRRRETGGEKNDKQFRVYAAAADAERQTRKFIKLLFCLYVSRCKV